MSKGIPCFPSSLRNCTSRASLHDLSSGTGSSAATSRAKLQAAPPCSVHSSAQGCRSSRQSTSESSQLLKPRCKSGNERGVGGSFPPLLIPILPAPAPVSLFLHSLLCNTKRFSGSSSTTHQQDGLLACQPWTACHQQQLLLLPFGLSDLCQPFRWHDMLPSPLAFGTQPLQRSPNKHLACMQEQADTHAVADGL